MIAIARPAGRERYMRKLNAWLTILMAGSFAFSPLYAQAQTAEAAGQGAQGVDTAWDRESVDIMTGTVNLAIPLYTAHSADNFEWSVTLSYNSHTWDSTVSNQVCPVSSSHRHPVGFGPAGFGWKVSFGRVYSTAYGTGASMDIYYYFEWPRGDT